MRAEDVEDRRHYHALGEAAVWNAWSNLAQQQLNWLLTSGIYTYTPISVLACRDFYAPRSLGVA